MQTDWPKVTDGTAQDARYPAALREGYFNVDERKFEDILSRTAEFAKQVPFHNLNQCRDNGWSGLFADEAVVMSEIIATDTNRMEAEFLALLHDESREPQAARYLVRFARRIDMWFRRLQEGESESSRVLSNHIKATVDKKLKAALAEILLHSNAAPEIEHRDADILSGLEAMWEVPSGASRHQPVSGRYQEQPADQNWLLRTAFYSFVSAMAYLKPVAAEHLDLSLKSGHHDPAMALFIAFAKLFRKAQGKANLFTVRHRDFYYGEVLGVVPKKQVADSTVLVLEATPGTTSVLVPAGTPFTAGKAGGAVELIYSSDAPLIVTDAKVCALLTLHSLRDPQISPEYELHYVNGVRSSEILSPNAPPPAQDSASFPLFGASKLETVAFDRNSELGFAVASPVLLLREGHRRIQVSVTFGIPADAMEAEAPTATENARIALGHSFRRRLFNQSTPEEKTAFADRAQTEQSDDLLHQDPMAMFYRVVGTAFEIDFTAATDWFAVPAYLLTAPQPGAASEPGVLTFELTLGQEIPPLVPCNPAIHGSGFNTLLPVLRFRLNPRATIYPYSLFRDLLVHEIAIQADVTGATNIVAWNQFGQVDPSRPFQPFGPLPTANSYLIFGHYESAKMNLTRMALNIEWGDLPDIPGGFSDYYRGYDSRYTNDQFAGDISALRDGRWRPAPDEDIAQAGLFDTQPEGGILGRQKRLGLDVLRYFKPLDPDISEDRFQYDQRARNGFFRVALAGPDSAFGHRDYPTLLTRVLSDNARSTRWRRREPEPLPNAPYTPIINRMSLDYTAISVIAAGAGTSDAANPLAEKVYRLHPFGTEIVDSNNPWTMLPIYEYDGNLFIGFRATERGGPLTLLFHLREDSATALASVPEPVYWSYLSSDRWLPLTGSAVLSDTTDGFLSSGIVTLDLPDRINGDNTVMPRDLYWLRVSAKGHFRSFCSLYSVRAQALQVTRCLTTKAPYVLPKPLPAGSIRSSVVSIPGLRSVSQPLASLGGREPESTTQMITRTAERLRHKHRASTPWDYERLVLEAFPGVFKVKCFSAMTSALPVVPRPGTVLVVLVPQQRESEAGVVFDPMLDAIELKHIREFLLPLTSAFTRIEVRNPAYERIQVRCKVSLTAHATRQRGTYLKLLNQAIVDYLSPWSSIGPTPRFGWSFRNDEVEAFIRKLPYVDFVTKFSMLHITQAEEGTYRLDDTARTGSADVTGSVNAPGSLKISPRYPWSLAIPTQRHFIETFDETRTMFPPAITGVGRMEIGSTFIVIA